MTEMCGTDDDIKRLTCIEDGGQIRKEFGNENDMLVHVNLIAFIVESTRLKKRHKKKTV